MSAAAGIRMRVWAYWLTAVAALLFVAGIAGCAGPGAFVLQCPPGAKPHTIGAFVRAVADCASQVDASGNPIGR